MFSLLRAFFHKSVTLFFSPEFLRFLLFGGIATLVSFFGGFLLYAFCSVPYAPAVFIGSAAAIIVNFALNYAFNFHYHGRSMTAQFITFASVAGVGTVLTTLLAKGLLYLGLRLFPTCSLLDVEVVCHVLAIGIVTFYSFFAHKYLSFNAGILAPLKKLAAHLMHRDQP
ncbi:MAG: GtrA family protein [Desulfovibrio sp.]|nr:GtrA family protein [Desulfovibrio sp.]